MSYQVLARKWRPATFDALVGQEHVLQALRHALDSNRLHHAYLFTGTRGVGKTTIARILARCLNCESGVSASPCGECGSCLEISEGRSVDLIEVDAASRTKVEDTRELLDNVQYAPTRSRYKVYLIDEVHMLSGHSFNALLKTLEEPPEHVKFLLATTDPQKLPATVLSRCLQFNLKNMSAERVVGHLRDVLSQENVEFDEPALWQLGRAAAGSMRDALSLTDQAIAFGDGALRDAEVASMLGSVDRRHVYELLEALLADDAKALITNCAQMDEQGVDFASAVDELCSVLHRCALAQAVPGAIDREFGDAERLADLAGRMTAEDVQLFYELAQSARSRVLQASDPRAAFEMLVLRLLAFRPVVALDPALTAEDLLESRSTAPEVKEPAKKSEPPSAAIAGPAAIRPEKSPVTPAEAASSGDTAPNSQAQAVQDTAPHTTQDTVADTGPWYQILSELGLSGSALNIASHCMIKSVQGASWHMVLDESRANLFNDRHVAMLAKALSEWRKEHCEVTITPGPVSEETPAMRRVRLEAERQAIAEAEINEDPQVLQLLSDFDAKVLQGSVTVEQP
ncbi:DNA polymerase III subunit gamma/tau [Congregibacter variabilis]|uniref:DNA polymerase III subunit gamma/tau n=1 Tax=Congregibacter variabilis TaxID=3081200 RepID=A0ABZ0I441_9GAMM|nr:DNA polymerase III subunit gamma/tau [Congregibacter sp. IMCC43200]